MSKPTVYLGGDHAGWEMKEAIETVLKADGQTVVDLGNQELNEADDYPDFAQAVAKAVAKDPQSIGLLTCGSAEGVAIVANKIKGIRAAVLYSPFAAESSRRDDSANVGCIPGRVYSIEEGVAIARLFLQTPFSDAERHLRRLAKIEKIEQGL